MSLGANSLISLRGLLEHAEHLLEDCDAGLAGLLQRLFDDLLADAGDLQIELNSGDAALSAGDLKVHVAEVIFVPHDVGQQNVLAFFQDQADRDPRDRVLDLERPYP